jgi:outer membrane protein TolC
VEGPPAEEVVPDGPGGELPRDVPSEGDAQAESAPRRPGDEADPDEIILLSDSVFTEQELELGTATVFTLHDAVEYAFLEAREIQDAREELYLAALDLTLERHLWTPQFVASVQAEYADYGQVRDFDHAMSAVSEVAVSQRLPYGGEVTARVINALMRDLGQHITSGEPGNFILRADIPLLRGAGRVALESRYQSERALIYAVRSFERFRQAFLVEIARDYFDLQQSRASITNAHTSYVSRLDAWRRAYLIATTSKARSIFDEPRARSSFRDAEAALVSSKEQYATALDRFKIRIGMTVDRLLDVVDQQVDRQSREIERLVPEVPEQLAVKVGLRYRLDLINSLDRVDDASRGVVIAENRILPDLDLSGSVSLATDPTHLSSTSYNTERSTWRGMIELRMDDRMSERTAYRQTLIQFRQEQRRHGQLADTVRSDVRRALRRIAQQRNIRDIQEMNVEENVFRREAADARFKLGDATNQDVIDAENDLLAARNRLAGAVAAYRTAILEFHRDVGTLRLGDEEPWVILPIEWPAAESLPPDEGP